MTSSIHLGFADSCSNGKLFRYIFPALRSRSFNAFRVILKASRVLRAKFASSISSFSEYENRMLREMIEISEHSACDSILENRELVFNNLRISEDDALARIAHIKTFPKISRNEISAFPSLKEGLFFADWDSTINMMAQNNRLLSTRRFCSMISMKNIFPVDKTTLWTLIDGECIRGISSVNQLTKFVRNLLQIDFSEMRGLGPLIRMAHLAALIRYLETVSEIAGTNGSLDVVKQVSCNAKLEFELRLVYLRQTPLAENRNLRGVYHRTYPVITQQIQNPGTVISDSGALLMLLGALESLKPDMQVIRGIISVLMLISNDTNLDVMLITRAINKLLRTTPSQHIPNRDVYSLLVVLSGHYQFEQLSIARGLLWLQLGISSSEVFDVFAVNSNNFGILASAMLHTQLSAVRRFVRWDIFRKLGHADIKQLLTAGKELGLDVRNGFSKVSIEKSVKAIISAYFSYLDDHQNGSRTYIPMMYIHPFVESIFWLLIQLGVAFGVEFDFDLHPSYLDYIFSNKDIKEVKIDSMMDTMIAAQHHHTSAAPEELISRVYQLDMLQMSQAFMTKILGNTLNDFIVFRCLTEPSYDSSLMIKSWRQSMKEGDVSAMLKKLKWLGSMVWKERQEVVWISHLLLHLPEYKDAEIILFK